MGKAFNENEADRIFRILLIENDIEKKHESELFNNIKGEFLEKEDNPHPYYRQLAKVVVQQKFELVRLYLNTCLQVVKKGNIIDGDQIYSTIISFIIKQFEEAEFYLKSSLDREKYHEIDWQIIGRILSEEIDLIIGYVKDKLIVEFGNGTKQKETPSLEKPRKIKKEENIFRHDGATWTVRYNGITKTIKHTKGMDYIAFLLRHQGQKIHSMKMYQAMSGFIPNVDERRSGTTGKRTLKDEGLQVGDKYTFPIVDRQTIDAVKNRIEQLKDEHEQAMIENDSVRENEISIKLDKLNDYLSKCTYKGKIRTISDATERMRQSIFRAITTAKKNIKKHHKELFEHLDKFLTTGTYNSYSPDTPVSWVQDQ